ncbi:hypothetical protein [Mesobacillus jeotgali]|uniref:hypothetical protein n=1 Tax=Mesobacillus jeotgali TaxID=129985 RepID=UPI0027D45CAF|nr:hypothetical protein [Mesobacillus jeotgali]
MLLILNFLKKQKTETPPVKAMTAAPKQVAVRKGEIGEYKIDIQLDQLPKEAAT